MNIINEQIIHVVFGEGEVISQESGRISIQFSARYGTKQFVYPDAFEKYLKICNVELETGILEDLNSKMLQIKVEKEQKQQQYLDEVKSRAKEKLELAVQKKKAAKPKSKIKK